MPNLQIGLTNEHHTQQAGHLFYLAFSEKFEWIMENETQGAFILANSFAKSACIIALEDNKVVGMVGLSSQNAPFIQPRWQDFRKTFGMVRGAWKLFLFAILEGKFEAGHQYIDGIAVDKSMRGQGVGQKLLARAEDFARQNGIHTMALDVVDTNPRAKALYERLGYVAIKETSLPFFLRNKMGFKAFTHMTKKL